MAINTPEGTVAPAFHRRRGVRGDQVRGGSSVEIAADLGVKRSVDRKMARMAEIIVLLDLVTRDPSDRSWAP